MSIYLQEVQYINLYMGEDGKLFTSCMMFGTRADAVANIYKTVRAEI